MRPISRKEKRLTDKPWIASGIRTFTKTKIDFITNTLKTKIDNTDNFKQEFYKKYINKLTPHY